MSIHLTPPRTGQPLLVSLQSRRSLAPRLADFPALELAATATTAELDTEGETFGGIAACLETMARLRLSASSTWLIMLLVKHGPQSCSELMARMKISSAAITGLITRLEGLTLITIQRGERTDRRLVIITATPATRKVLASLVALTALGAAASILTQTRTPKTPRA